MNKASSTNQSNFTTVQTELVIQFKFTLFYNDTKTVMNECSTEFNVHSFLTSTTISIMFQD